MGKIFGHVINRLFLSSHYFLTDTAFRLFYVEPFLIFFDFTQSNQNVDAIIHSAFDGFLFPLIDRFHIVL